MMASLSSSSSLLASEEPETVLAVNTLHKALVTLRQELESKDKIIRHLRSKVPDDDATSLSERSVHSDPIMAFVAEDDDAEEGVQVAELQTGNKHHVHAEVHATPKDEHLRPIRIGQGGGSRRRSCTGSQTDISAIGSNNSRNKDADVVDKKLEEQLMWPEWFDSSSTQCLMAVADEFVRVAKKRLVEHNDWGHIWHRAKQSL